MPRVAGAPPAAAAPLAATGTPSLSCPAVQSSLSIPNELESAINLDKVNHTVTLPLYKGASGDQRVWYVLTDTSDLQEASRLGINWSPKLANALGTPAVQHATLSPASGAGQLDMRSVVHFQGTVDFS